jgi:hypothetical protein
MRILLGTAIGLSFWLISMVAKILTIEALWPEAVNDVPLRVIVFCGIFLIFLLPVTVWVILPLMTRYE